MSEVSGGGSIAVAEPELLEHAARHEAFAMAAENLILRLRRIDGIVGRGAATGGADAAEYAIEDAVRALDDARSRAVKLAEALRASATTYGIADRVLDGFVDLGAGYAWYFAGKLALLGLPWLLSMGQGLKGLAGSGAFDWLPQSAVQNNGAYTSPLVGDASESLANGADEFIAGVLGIPLSVVPLLGGIRFSAGTVARAGGAFRALGDSPVRIEKRVAGPAPQPPADLTDALVRIKPEEEGAQVVIERYELMGGGSVANVYVDGTIDWSLIATDEPFDMSSNVNGVAGADTAGYQAVREAMLDAGLDDGTPVQLFGFSQGALQATVIAESREFNVRTLVTVGSPGDHLLTDHTIRGISIGHDEDPVNRASPGDSGNLISWRTTRFGDAPSSPSDGVVPAHQFPPYLDTAREIDESGVEIIREEIRRIVDMTDGAVRSTSTAYVVERVQALMDQRVRRSVPMIGRTMMPISQLMRPSTRAPRTPHQNPSTIRPNPSRPEIQATRSSRRCVHHERDEAERQHVQGNATIRIRFPITPFTTPKINATSRKVSTSWRVSPGAKGFTSTPATMSVVSQRARGALMRTRTMNLMPATLAHEHPR